MEAAERWLAQVQREEALNNELIEVKEALAGVQEQLEAEREAHSAGMLEAKQKVVSVLSERIKELEYSCGKARVRDLWLRGII